MLFFLYLELGGIWLVFSAHTDRGELEGDEPRERASEDVFVERDRTRKGEKEKGSSSPLGEEEEGEWNEMK